MPRPLLVDFVVDFLNEEFGLAAVASLPVTGLTAWLIYVSAPRQPSEWHAVATHPGLTALVFASIAFIGMTIHLSLFGGVLGLGLNMMVWVASFIFTAGATPNGFWLWLAWSLQTVVFVVLRNPGTCASDPDRYHPDRVAARLRARFPDSQ
jgi:hypothetical protein